jgi:hypothetical protein
VRKQPPKFGANQASSFVSLKELPEKPLKFSS